MDAFIVAPLAGLVGFGLGLYLGQRTMEGVQKDLDNAKKEVEKFKAKIDAKKKT